MRSEDPDDKDRQEYYAGGASSGAAILDPKKQETDIFKRLQAVGLCPPFLGCWYFRPRACTH